MMVMLAQRRSAISTVLSAISLPEILNTWTINFGCSTWNQASSTLLSKWSNIWAECAMWTLGNPPMGVGVNWGSVVR